MMNLSRLIRGGLKSNVGMLLSRNKPSNQKPEILNIKQNQKFNEINATRQKQVGIQDVKQKWDKLTDMYLTLDGSPQTFFFTLLNLLRIRQAQNILEIACGGGLLLPFVIDQKRSSTKYVATDLSSNMISRANQRLKAHFQKYNSKLTLEQWLKQQNMTIKQANGEESIKGHQPFDRVICNLVLMLTTNPKNILKNAYQVSSKKAKMGVTIWGDRESSSFLTLYQRAIKSLNLPIVQPATPFDYQHKIKQDFKQTGWKIKLEWSQNSPFHFAGETNQIDQYLSTMYSGGEDYSKQDLQKIKQRMKQLYLGSIANKAPLNMTSKLFILEK